MEHFENAEPIPPPFVEGVLESQKVTIRTAALRVGEEIFEGASHAEAFALLEAKYPDWEERQMRVEEGFLTTNDEFVDRVRAMELAQAAGQVEEGEWGDEQELHSEDITVH